MIVKAFGQLNEEVASAQQEPSYVKYNLQYDQESKNFIGSFEIVRAQINMVDFMKILKFSADENLSHFIIENEEGNQLYGVSMLFAKNPTINMNEGFFYMKMNIEINQNNMDQYTQFLEKHNLYS